MTASLFERDKSTLLDYVAAGLAVGGLAVGLTSLSEAGATHFDKERAQAQHTASGQAQAEVFNRVQIELEETAAISAAIGLAGAAGFAISRRA
jgi:hypothetical protein